MPRNQFQRMIFALITVIITVHAYVFYSLYVVNGDVLMAHTQTSGVLEAIKAQGGMMVFGRMMPLWALVLIEFALAYTLEMVMGSPCSFKLACKVFDPRSTHPVLFESAIICATVGLMCPAMSFLAAWMYYPYYAGFNLLTLLANWLELVCYNFPFAFFTQLFFIQPLVRTLFRLIFRKDIARQKAIREREEKRIAAEKAAAERKAAQQAAVAASCKLSGTGNSSNKKNGKGKKRR